MIVLLAHFQIIVDVIEYYASGRTFAMNGTELCASVFVVGFVPDMLRLYIARSCYTLKNKSNETLTAKHSFLEKFDQNSTKMFFWWLLQNSRAALSTYCNN